VGDRRGLAHDRADRAAAGDGAAAVRGPWGAVGARGRADDVAGVEVGSDTPRSPRPDRCGALVALSPTKAPRDLPGRANQARSTPPSSPLFVHRPAPAASAGDIVRPRPRPRPR